MPLSKKRVKQLEKEGWTVYRLDMSKELPRPDISAPQLFYYDKHKVA